MARKAREIEETQTAETPYQSQSPFSDVIDTTEELVNPSPVRPSAAERTVGIEVEAPPQYRVMTSQFVMGRGGRTWLRAGKIVDAHNFDLHALHSQGVQLERV